MYPGERQRAGLFRNRREYWFYFVRSPTRPAVQVHQIIGPSPVSGLSDRHLGAKVGLIDPAVHTGLRVQSGGEVSPGLGKAKQIFTSQDDQLIPIPPDPRWRDHPSGSFPVRYLQTLDPIPGCVLRLAGRTHRRSCRRMDLVATPPGPFSYRAGNLRTTIFCTRIHDAHRRSQTAITRPGISRHSGYSAQVAAPGNFLPQSGSYQVAEHLT
jgi:hypothetical protein